MPAEGPGLHNTNGITYVTGILLIMSHQLLGTVNKFSVHRMLYLPFDGHNYRFVHHIADHNANTLFS